MKKYMMTGITLVVLLGGLTSCGGSSDIGKDKALQIALADVKLEETDISRLYVEKSVENGKDTYELKFSSGNTEYEYEILATDGKIIKTSFEHLPSLDGGNRASSGNLRDDLLQQKNDNTLGVNEDTSTNNQISRAEAAKQALARVPGASEKDLKIELDYDDGKYKYEGDIIYDGREYEFEIDAVTGDFLEWSEEKR